MYLYEQTRIVLFACRHVVCLKTVLIVRDKIIKYLVTTDIKTTPKTFWSYLTTNNII